ncbi:SDR family NAD(P)-dependent oxidoreductase [Chloroflexota bacterium]
MQADLSGKVAVVTGSSWGIGRAVALKLAENGADIVVNAMHSRDRGLETARQIEEMGRRAVFEQADITSYQQVRRMAESAVAAMGKVDILVASGAREQTQLGFFRETDPEAYIESVKSQWLSRLNCARAFLDHMIERNGGKVILISTDAGRMPTPGECLTGGAGAALVMSTKVLAAEFARWGIRVNTICLTVTRENLDTKVEYGRSIDNIIKKILERQPFPTTSKDIAEAALFLASEAADQITGQILSVNGGMSFPG